MCVRTIHLADDAQVSRVECYEFGLRFGEGDDSAELVGNHVSQMILGGNRENGFSNFCQHRVFALIPTQLIVSAVAGII